MQCTLILISLGIIFPRAAKLRQDTKTIDKDVFKMTLERFVCCIILFCAEWSCGSRKDGLVWELLYS